MAQSNDDVFSKIDELHPDKIFANSEIGQLTQKFSEWEKKCNDFFNSLTDLQKKQIEERKIIMMKNSNDYFDSLTDEQKQQLAKKQKERYDGFQKILPI